MTLGQGVMSQALSSVAPFAKQLFVDKDIRNDHLDALLSDYNTPKPIEFIANTCRYLVDTRWGKVGELAHH